ncbi:E3 ubiquitin-protein ligase TRIM8-like [Hyperolius riggenbachi]|uniref:E3 ubiquitin-protein ligase TRIM8-like n=1 Tax=Hyperolius riggenbachi TaxID=752182 RepID=UPI0035A34E50
MAFAPPRGDLECVLCQNVYTDPVTLRCQHSFCRKCIDRALSKQMGFLGYSCPKCKERFRRRPSLQRDSRLYELLENVSLVHQDKEKTRTFCSYCFQPLLPAVKYCLLCEASLCDKHLRVHSKSPEHVLCDPNTSVVNRKCTMHKKVLEYYCGEDAICICVYCLAEKHRGHHVETTDEASETKKKKLRLDQQQVVRQREEVERRVTNLQECRRKAQEKADGETERVTALFRDLRRRLEELEKRILRDISRWVQTYDDNIWQLEMKKSELCGKMRHIEELCNMTDPLTVLQESDTDDRKTASWSESDQNYPETPERCQDYPQVMSRQSFSSGRHYWEIDITGSDSCILGVCYPSIDRNAVIGYNNKSWSLYRNGDQYSMTHDSEGCQLADGISSNRVRIYLDYEAGQISFYDMCDPIRHLHTFTATFTEPLHAAIGVWEGSIKIISRSEKIGDITRWGRI